MNLNYLSLLSLALLFSNQVIMAGSLPGQVVGWGDNSLGQATGIPSRIPSTGVVTIAGVELTNVIAISAGNTHGLALRSDGTVVGWGDNRAGEAIGYDPVDSTNGVVRINGEVLTNVAALAAGKSFSLALKKDGSLVAWGVIQLPDGLSNIVAISASGGSCLGLRRDGTVAAWGAYKRVPKDLSNVVAIAVSQAFAGWDLALKNDGTVIEWNVGRPLPGGPPATVTNDHGRTEIGYRLQDSRIVEGLSNVVEIAAGETHSLALQSNGTVFGWGIDVGGDVLGIMSTNFENSGFVKINGQFLTNAAEIAAGNDYSLALKKDGTVEEWGFKPYHILDAPAGLNNVVAIAAGDNFCLAITTSTNVPGMKK